MEKKLNIAKLLRVFVIFSLLFLLVACGINGETTNAINDPATDNVVSTEEFDAQRADCWQAQLVSTIYVTTGKLIMGMYESLTKGAMALMMVAFAIWLGFQIMNHVSSFAEESAGEIWSEVIKKFFVCMVCGLLAGSPTGVLFILNSIIFPVYNAFLELASAVLGTYSLESRFQIIGHDVGWLVPTGGSKYDISCKVTEGVTKATLNGFPDGPRQMMECLTCSLRGHWVQSGITFGWLTMREAGVMAFFTGLIIFSCFGIVCLGFVLYLIDTIFRFALMVMLLPLLIMAFAFKTTKKCVKVGFLTILNSAAFMMMMSIVMIVLIATMQEILTEQSAAFDKNNLGDFSVPFLLMLLMSFLAIKSINVAREICDKLVGGGGDTQFQKKFGTFMAMVARTTFLRAGSLAKNVIKSKSK